MNGAARWLRISTDMHLPGPDARHWAALGAVQQAARQRSSEVSRQKPSQQASAVRDQSVCFLHLSRPHHARVMATPCTYVHLCPCEWSNCAILLILLITQTLRPQEWNKHAHLWQVLCNPLRVQRQTLALSSHCTPCLCLLPHGRISRCSGHLSFCKGQGRLVYCDVRQFVLGAGECQRETFDNCHHQATNAQERVVDYKIHTHATYATCEVEDSFLVAPAYDDGLGANKDKQFFSVNSFFLKHNVTTDPRWSDCSQQPMQARSLTLCTPGVPPALTFPHRPPP